MADNLCRQHVCVYQQLSVCCAWRIVHNVSGVILRFSLYCAPLLSDAEVGVQQRCASLFIWRHLQHLGLSSHCRICRFPLGWNAYFQCNASSMCCCGNSLVVRVCSAVSARTLRYEWSIVIKAILCPHQVPLIVCKRQFEVLPGCVHTTLQAGSHHACMQLCV